MLKSIYSNFKRKKVIPQTSEVKQLLLEFNNRHMVDEGFIRYRISSCHLPDGDLTCVIREALTDVIDELKRSLIIADFNNKKTVSEIYTELMLKKVIKDIGVYIDDYEPPVVEYSGYNPDDRTLRIKISLKLK